MTAIGPPEPAASDVAQLALALGPGERVLVLAASGRGKRAVLRELASSLAAREGTAYVLAADPGHPAWGPPTAVSLVRFAPETAAVPPTTSLRESLLALAALGSLDPVRRQARYLDACQRLAALAPADAALLVDVPSVLRAPLAERFVAALVSALGAAWLLAIGDDPPLLRLLALFQPRPDLRIVRLPARPSPTPASPSKPERRRRRALAWERYLDQAPLATLLLAARSVRGVLPEDGAWSGRVVSLHDAAGLTLGLGEVERLEPPGATPGDDGACLVVRTPVGALGEVALVDVSSASRTSGGGLGTVRSPRRPAPRIPPAFTMPLRPEARIPISWPESAGQAPWEPRFLNPLIGDPALMLRHQRSGRALLLDLGWLEPLPTRLLHAVTDVFFSHCHMDHMQGLVILLRVMLGPGGSVRLYGPAGLAAHVEALMRAFDFGLLGDSGPELVVHEVLGDSLRIVALRCAAPPVVERHGERPLTSGRLLDEPNLRVEAATLEHKGPVLAFRVTARRQHVLRHGQPFERDYVLTYVTDAGDTPDNRAAIARLAEGADLFVCEAAFTQTHAERARETGHLTARACGSLAREAGVKRLVPFHLSARYHDDPARIYREVLAEFEAVEPAVDV
jgi:ribonuclease Z